MDDLEDYGMRHGGAGKKYTGWKGPLKDVDGNTVTELSIGVNINGKEVEIPLIVPSLSEKETTRLLSKKKPTDAILKKAYDHAITRMKLGKSPFKEPEDDE